MRASLSSIRSPFAPNDSQTVRAKQPQVTSYRYCWPAGVRYSVARLESFLVTKTQCDPIAEGIKKIVLSLVVLVANSEILDLIDEMVS